MTTPELLLTVARMHPDGTPAIYNQARELVNYNELPREVWDALIDAERIAAEHLAARL